MRQHQETYGYYHITLISDDARVRLMQSNSERAFIVAQLQDMLSSRLIINEVPAHKQLASCIDLLSFSIQSREVHLLVFSIDEKLCRHVAESLIYRLSGFRAEWNSGTLPHPLAVSFSVKKLSGAEQALTRSVAFHLLHKDWEYDRYSSIGFYLHDRRGDWMRTWRLTRLYENNPTSYRRLVYAHGPSLRA